MNAKIVGHFKKGFLSGILVALPLFITVVVLKFLLGMVTGMLEPVLLRIYPHIPIWVKTVVSILILCIVIYLLGLATRHFLGRWFLNRLDELLLRIPLLSTIYGSSREIVRIFLNPDRKRWQYRLKEREKELIVISF